jgi:hypothetical protein
LGPEAHASPESVPKLWRKDKTGTPKIPNSQQRIRVKQDDFEIIGRQISGTTFGVSL